MNETELKPCPFCGKPATMHTIEPHKHISVPLPDYGGGTFIECTGCTCAMSAETEAEAVKSWNRRIEINPRCSSNEEVDYDYLP